MTHVRRVYLVALAAVCALGARRAIGDSVTLSNVPLAGAPWVLLEGWRDDGFCWSDYIEEYTGPLSVQNHVPGSSCTAQAAVGTRFRAFVVDTGVHPDTAPGRLWTTGVDLLSYELHERLSVPLNVWVVGNLFDLFPWPFSSTSVTFAKDAVARSNKIFNQGRVGVVFSGTATRRQTVLRGTAMAQTIGKNCLAVPGLVAAGLPLYSDRAINVYFVPVVADGAGTGRGLNCFPSGYPGVIYISLAFHTPTSLAHELGHALGHQGSYQHVDGIGSFGNRNLMRTTFSALTEPVDWSNETAWLAARNELTFGQAYRMNVHRESWVNLPRGALPAVRDGIVWSCSDYWWMTDPCPDLSVGAP